MTVSRGTQRDLFLVRKLQARVRGEPDPVDPLATPAVQEVDAPSLDVTHAPSHGDDGRSACRDAAAALVVLADALDRIGNGEVLGRNAIVSVRVAAMRGEDACQAVVAAFGGRWSDERGRVRVGVAVAQSCLSAIQMTRHYLGDVVRLLEPGSQE